MHIQFAFAIVIQPWTTTYGISSPNDVNVILQLNILYDSFVGLCEGRQGRTIHYDTHR